MPVSVQYSVNFAMRYAYLISALALKRLLQTYKFKLDEAVIYLPKDA
jgi:hypothetical protein